MNELREFAAGRYSVFTAADASRRGVSIDSVRRGVRSGSVLRLQAGVFAFAGSPDSWERSMLAACLAGGAGAVASHRSAARIWRLTAAHGDVLEMSVPRRSGPRPRGTIVHRSGDLRPEHTTVRNCIPVTNPLRTMVDLAAVLEAGAVEDALDAGLRSPSLFSVAAVEATLNRLAGKGRPGVGVLRKVLEEREFGKAVSDSELETRMGRLLKQAGLPGGVFHHAVTTAAGVFLAEVDFAYPQIKLAVEVDGFAVHGTPRAMAKDFVRQNGLVPHGWRVLRFTWWQVVNEPGMVGAAIRAAIEALQAA